jgi:hypothetical protein
MSRVVIPGHNAVEYCELHQRHFFRVDSCADCRRHARALELAHPGTVHACSCGRRHTQAQWGALPFVGVQETSDGERLELRNCSCGSTRALELPQRTQPLVELIEEHTKLTTRAIQLAKAEIKRIDVLLAMPSIDVALGERLFETMTAPKKTSAAPGLEVINGGAS